MIRVARIGRGQDTVPVPRVSRGRRATAASTATPAATEKRENASAGLAEAELVISVVSAPALATTRQITQITYALRTPRAYPGRRATIARIVTVRRRRPCVPRAVVIRSPYRNSVFVPTNFQLNVRILGASTDLRREEEEEEGTTTLIYIYITAIEYIYNVEEKAWM